MHRLTATDAPMVRYTRTIFPSYADGKSAVIEGDFEPFIVHYAETFIIPASIKEYSIKPYGCDEVKVLKAYVRS